MIEKFNVCGKNIYIVDVHNEVLVPWAIERNKLVDAPNLITFDTHSDTHQAFTQIAYSDAPYGDYDTISHFRNQYLDSINIADIRTVESAVRLLRNDEHIVTAQKKDIINTVLVECYGSNGGYPINMGDYYLDNEDKPNLYVPSTDDIEDNQGNNLFEISMWEDKFLIEVFKRYSDMIGRKVSVDDFIKENYILDIDLDCFHHVSAINPTNDILIKKLFYHSTAITIAKEFDYVKGNCKDKIEPTELLGIVMDKTKSFLES